MTGARRLGEADWLQVCGLLVAEEEDVDLVVGAHAALRAPEHQAGCKARNDVVGFDLRVVVGVVFEEELDDARR